MDTKFWGPSGWRLLHMIAASPYADSVLFWKKLPFVLPCKFCRASLTDYYKLLPIPKQLKEFPEWLYKIHNLVNQKLRDQGQHLPPDPPFSMVRDQYTEYLDSGCSRTEFPGWDFLFSIADNHPDSSPSKPMPDVPNHVLQTLEEKNRYNLLTARQRKAQLREFWRLLPAVLPFKEWQTSWRRHARSLDQAVQNRKSALAWLWKIRCGMEAELQQIGKDTFYGLCKRIATYRSGCATSKRAKTCRRIPSQNAGARSKRKTHTRKQR
jgi:hypothetical protein